MAKHLIGDVCGRATDGEFLGGFREPVSPIVDKAGVGRIAIPMRHVDDIGNHVTDPAVQCILRLLRYRRAW